MPHTTTIILYDEISPERLEAARTELKKSIQPVIRVYDAGDNTLIAVEGCPQLKVMHELGIVAKVRKINADKHIDLVRLPDWNGLEWFEDRYVPVRKFIDQYSDRHPSQIIDMQVKYVE